MKQVKKTISEKAESFFGKHAKAWEAPRGR